MGGINYLPLKKMLKSFLLSLLIVLSLTIKTRAQDVTFTHFLYNPIYFNPAAVGIDRGLLMSLNYRRAMNFMPSKFETYAFGAGQSLHDLDIRGLGGVGFFMVKNQEGAGNLSTISVGIPFSARVPLNDNLSLQLGIAPVIYQKYVDWSRIILGNQLDPSYGQTLFVSQMPSSYLNNVTFFDFHLGLMLRYESDPSFQSNVGKDVFDIGLSVQHLPEPDQKFSSEPSKLPSRYTLMMRYSKSIGDRILEDGHIQPLLLFEKQGSMQDFVAGLNLTGSNLNVGTFIRKDQNKLLKITELVLLAGIQFPINNDYFSKLHINYSFDYSLNAAKINGNATHEVSLIFQLPSLHQNKTPCKMYF